MFVSQLRHVTAHTLHVALQVGALCPQASEVLLTAGVVLVGLYIADLVLQCVP